MNKSELVKSVSQITSKTKSETDKMIDAFIEVIKANMVNGNSVKIAGFGTFGVSVRKARTARNPKTGTTLEVPERCVPSFKAGKELKTLLNKWFGFEW